jgi:hypothetical protein
VLFLCVAFCDGFGDPCTGFCRHIISTKAMSNNSHAPKFETLHSSLLCIYTCFSFLLVNSMFIFPTRHFLFTLFCFSSRLHTIHDA